MSVTLGSSVTSISYGAFDGCFRLVEVINKSSLDIVAGNGNFYNALIVHNGDSKIVNKDGYIFVTADEINYLVNYLGAETELTLPESYNGDDYVINSCAFSSCDKITSITIPSSVTSIGYAAFRYCDSLVSISIPFVGNTYYGTENTHFSYIFGAYSYDYDNWWVPSSLKEVIITGGYRICDYAFYGCDSLTSVVIPNSVCSIGYSAFKGCSSLVSITIPFVGNRYDGTENTHFGYIFGSEAYIEPDYDYDYDYGYDYGYEYSPNLPYSLKEVIITGGTKIADYAFYECGSIKSLTLPEGLISIGKEAFYGCSPENVYFNNDVLAWCGISFNDSESNPLSNESNLYCLGNLVTALYAEDMMPVINAYAFYEYTKLTSVYLHPGIGDVIGDYAFYGCSGIKTLFIPESVTKIGKYTFCGCSGIESLSIPDSVITIGDYAFSYCTSLMSVTIPEGVTAIGDYAFSDCTSLMSVTILEGVTAIGNHAFSWCRNLTSVTILEGVTAIGSYAFYHCDSLTSITIPESVTAIGDYAFYLCSGLTSITIPEGVTTIGYNAFSWCTSLASVTIPNSVTSIGGGAFSDCKNLVSVTIPNSVTSIGGDAFSGCTSLAYNEYDNAYYIGNESNPYLVLAKAKSSTIGSCRIHDDTKHIHSGAFHGCASLMSVTIGNSVTSIGSSAFYACHRLIEVINKSSLNITAGYSSNGYVGYYAIEVHSGESKAANENGYLFYTYKGINYLLGYAGTDTELVLPENYNGGGYEIYEYAFSRCTGLTSVTIGSGVTAIGSYAFYDCTGLTSVTIGSGVTAIGSYAFYDCTGLTSVTIGSGVTAIGSHAFYDCTSLTSITVDGNNPNYSSIDGNLYSKDGKTLIKYAMGKEDASFEIPDGVVTIESGAFSYCENLTSVTIPDSVIVIGSYAFTGCSKLFEEENGIYYVDNWVVDSDHGLYDITLRYGTRGIAEYAFSGDLPMSPIYSVTIPDSVRVICSNAFSSFDSLTEVSLGYGVEYIATNAFGSSVYTIYAYDMSGWYKTTSYDSWITKSGGRESDITSYYDEYYYWYKVSSDDWYY